MAIKFSTTVKNAMLDAIEGASGVGTSAILKIKAGSVPTNISDADASSTTLATLNLPSDWMQAASNGTKDKTGTWEDLNPDAAGTAAYFRIYASDGTTQHVQGTVVQGSGDLSLSNTSITTPFGSTRKDATGSLQHHRGHIRVAWDTMDQPNARV